jgi:hypothetical protein
MRSNIGTLSLSVRYGPKQRVKETISTVKVECYPQQWLIKLKTDGRFPDKLEVII